MPLVSVSIC